MTTPSPTEEPLLHIGQVRIHPSVGTGSGFEQVTEATWFWSEDDGGPQTETMMQQNGNQQTPSFSQMYLKDNDTLVLRAEDGTDTEQPLSEVIDKLAPLRQQAQNETLEASKQHFNTLFTNARLNAERLQREAQAHVDIPRPPAVTKDSLKAGLDTLSAYKLQPQGAEGNAWVCTSKVGKPFSIQLKKDCIRIDGKFKDKEALVEAAADMMLATIIQHQQAYLDYRPIPVAATPPELAGQIIEALKERIKSAQRERITFLEGADPDAMFKAVAMSELDKPAEESSNENDDAQPSRRPRARR